MRVVLSSIGAVRTPPAPVVQQPFQILSSTDHVVTPLAVDGYQSTREANTIVHRVLGRSDPDITLRPARLRTGTLTLVFDDETESAFAEAVHTAPQVLTLVCPADLSTSVSPGEAILLQRPTVAMRYVASGRITRTLDATRKGWVVTVDFTEVSP